MDDLNLLVSLHVDAERQGPGGDAQTARSIELAGLRRGSSLRIADIGCGTGASTLVLAAMLGAQITAVDVLPAFLERLRIRAASLGLDAIVTTDATPMQELSYPDAAFDAIWSEGAIYNIGFERGVDSWRRFIKPGGILAVSELTWLTDRRPDELTAYWVSQYPEVDTAAAKLAVLEHCGYSPLGYFVLPQHCWLDNYYRPMQRRFAAFLRGHGSSPAAKAIVAAEEHEIALYERYRDFVGYGYYIARRRHE